MHKRYCVCRIGKNLLTQADLEPLPPGATTLHHKAVDFRKEKAVVRDMAYLNGIVVYKSCPTDST